MKFLFNVTSIEGTRLESNIQIAVDEGAKRTYKPRSGKANANQDKYSQQMLDFIYAECEDQLKALGYAHLFNQPSAPNQVDGHPQWIKTFNHK